ncbi:glycoside hydrolase family 43 protein [Henriciella sp.]|uniref:glycoside hydrolase family 43 protein n=1 Tax=Henriciella sp. TaxID=1968823 RepID=UPI0026269B92|nr:glycoside hydrolase family 43 protein [Henriciella sp.]
MSSRVLLSLAAAIAATACAGDPASQAEPVKEDISIARFDWFEYRGDDPAFRDPPGPGGYLNPVLAGFYPDPSVTQADDGFYLVTSTFGYFPGIPVMYSRDLVNWQQVGNVIDRSGMLDFDDLGLSRGVFAPTIEYHQGTFYVANTCVDCGGNFIVTSEDPAGPWSDPVWLPEVGGIDPSLFFDTDGKVWLMNNDAPEGGSTYEGHRAIWIREIDPETFQPVSEPVMIIDGGVRPEDKPIWIEGPHIYKLDGWYYLSAAEGGTAIDHSQVVLRSKSITGPYTAHEKNPILTQRDLSADRPNPITSVGHADLVQDAAGDWWATFLGVRPYEGDHYNTGRETFLMPVAWKDGWPVITETGEEVPYSSKTRPAGFEPLTEVTPLSGNFVLREEFEGDALPLHWMTLRVPESPWWSLPDGALEIEARPVSIGSGKQPSYLGRRQQHQNAEVTTSLTFAPDRPGSEAGIAVLQNDNHFYALGLGKAADGSAIITLRRKAGGEAPEGGEEIARDMLTPYPDTSLQLRIQARGDVYDFAYRPDESDEWTTIARGLDGKPLSTRTAGGFVGATFGLYAEAMPR